MISPSQRPLPDNTQHSQETNFQALGGIRTHDRSRREAVDLRLKPRGHWDRLLVHLYNSNNKKKLRANAAIWCHKMCTVNHSTLQYIHITTQGLNGIQKNYIFIKIALMLPSTLHTTRDVRWVDFSVR